jgi:hypothetical protein
MRVVPGKRRCRFHGGLSTGPKTKAGRARIADLLEIPIGPLLARARVLVAKVVVGQFLSSPTPACWLGMAPPGGTATDVPRLM